MVRGFKLIQSWGEVAPAALACHRKSSSFTKLEPIIEEGLETGIGVARKGMFSHALPLLLSGFMYIMLFRDLV